MKDEESEQGGRGKNGEQEYILSYIFFYLIDELYKKEHEWVIIKMIEDSIFGFNTSHYFGQSFYLLFFSCSLLKDDTIPQPLKWQKHTHKSISTWHFI